MLDPKKIILTQIFEGGGGGVEVEPLSVTENGTYTADEGKAYSPVTANVPNSYAAGDEGKVVSSGALVSQTSGSATQNGTVDTTLINSLTVNVSGGGGASNIVTGTFTGAEPGVMNISLPYDGSGFPIAVTVYTYPISSFDSTVLKYAISMVVYTKYNTDTPTYSANNLTNRMTYVCEQMNDNSGTLTAQRGYNAILYNIDASTVPGGFLRFKNAKTLSVAIIANDGMWNYGFLQDLEYHYIIEYSS